jgi:hypothetical protein
MLSLISRAAVLCLCLVLLSCSRPSGDTWIVLSRRADPDITWTPKAPQVTAAISKARQHLQEAAQHGTSVRAAQQILMRWDNYRVHALGLSRDGASVLRLEFITPDAGDTWREDKAIGAMDGGTRYWRADYDPRAGKIIWWQSNGDA